MKKNDQSAIVREIALATNHPEEFVSKMYAGVTDNMKHDARIMDFIPLLAAKRVRENLRTHASDRTNDTGALIRRPGSHSR
jgi:hypothetical protein